MKQLFFVALFVCLSLTAYAQENQDPTTNGHVVYKEVPKKLNIKDKIFVTNKSPYYILQIVVAVVEGNNMIPLGSATSISPNERYELASFGDNTLKEVRGKKIAIKAKGAKLAIVDDHQTRVDIPFYSVSVRHKNLDPEVINNLKPEDITYEFDATLSESHHDLYIDVFNSSGKDVMDF